MSKRASSINPASVSRDLEVKIFECEKLYKNNLSETVVAIEIEESRKGDGGSSRIRSREEEGWGASTLE